MKKQTNPKVSEKKSHPESTAKQKTEKDADDLIHSSDPEAIPSSDTDEVDFDDIVHSPKFRSGTTEQENSIDPDDLIHRYTDEEDD